MALLKVNGVAIKAPSSMSFGIQDISAPDAGRGQDLTMYKGKLGQKQTIQLGWNMVTPVEAAAILTAFDPEYFNVTYTDPKTNATVTKEFYCGDRSAPIQQWNVNNKYFNSITFNIIER